ncbi:hypothetical protein [Nocardia anaemiae]|uniref:hypothetical protein n=1 Tax=Nocardia anaemiae TaxID=263910 RepID=UPI0007A55375|nr:hypothetical protein [Nocardia anaemiae]
MTLGRGRARIITIVTGTAFAATATALVAGAASAHPPLPDDGDLTVTCVVQEPGEPHVVIQERRELGAPGAPLPPIFAPPGCPDIDPSGPVIVRPDRPGEPARPGVVYIQPARPAPTGSSGS